MTKNSFGIMPKIRNRRYKKEISSENNLLKSVLLGKDI